MATVACKCGEKFHPNPEHYGREVRCRKCGRLVKLIPDLAFEPPPSSKSAPFTQTFTESAREHDATHPSSYGATPATGATGAHHETEDPDRPRGLHPEVRRILVYICIGALVASGLLIAYALKGGAPPEPG